MSYKTKAYTEKVHFSYDKDRLLLLINDNIQGMSDLHFGGNGPRLTPEKIAYERGKEGYDLLETDYR